MRRTLFILVGLIVSTQFIVLSAAINPYIRFTIESINRGDFETAAEEFSVVKDWNEDKDEKNTGLDIERGYAFLQYADSIAVPKSICLLYAKYLAQKAYETSLRYLEFNNISYAKRCAEIKLQTIKYIYGEEHQEYAQSLLQLGSICINTDYQEAERYFQEMLRVPTTYYNDEAGKYYQFDHSYAYIQLGDVYVARGDIETAERYYKQALDSCESHYHTRLHSTYASYLNILGNLYRSIDMYEQAEQCYIESLNIMDTVSNKQNTQFLTCLDAIRTLYYYWGDQSLAEYYTQTALEIRKMMYGTNHPEYAKTLNSYGQIFLLGGDYSSAEKRFKEASNIFKEDYIRTLNFKTEKQREVYWNSIYTGFMGIYPLFCYRYTSSAPLLSAFAYDNELFTKGVLLESSNAIKRSILESGDEALIRQWDRLTALKQEIMHLQEKDPQDASIKAAEQQAEALEKDITRASAAYRESMKQWEISWEDVRKALKPKEVAIEFMIAPLNADSVMYCALMLRHDSKQPELIALFNQRDADGLIEMDNDAHINRTFTTHGEALSQLIWAEISKRIKEGETVYFAPIGLLHQLPIEALPYKGDKTMADAYHLVRLSSTREIIKQQDAQETITHAVLYGDIPYEVEADDMNHQHNELVRIEAAPQAPPTTLLAANRSHISGKRDQFENLPGTKEEIRQIGSMLHEHKLHVQTFQSNSANEEAFKALSGKRQHIIHVATHGFFWADEQAKQEKYFTQRGPTIGDASPEASSIDPLDRCGLAFAGANTALRGESHSLSDSIEDGIATAKEISTMDLRGAEIVVLSACETGQGDVYGEGVFGLQRGFKMAGAKTLIVSLWKVNDAATQLLMTEFYKNWIHDRMDKRKAFKEAQDTVRKKYEEPVYWAAFVMLD